MSEHRGFIKHIGRISQVLVAIVVLIAIWQLISGIRGCQKMGIRKYQGIIEKAITTIEEKEDREWGEPIDMEVKPRLFGQDDKPRLEIVIPPHEDTIRMRIPGGEKVYGVPGDVELQVTKIPPAIIRLKPSLHLCCLTDFSKVYPGVKIRFVEIWKFGICGYMTTAGPGVGCDFRVISNISVGTVKTMDKWMAELSVKL